MRNPATPQHTLPRTAPAVTPLLPTSVAPLPRAPAPRPRQPPQSLSLGSFGVAARFMCLRVFCTVLASFLFVLPSSFCEDEHPASSPPQPPLSRAGLGALEHASKLVAAINALDWKTVEASAPLKGTILPLLQRDATGQKDWPGIGAYRGSDYDPEHRTLRHRFAYGPTRTTPHEVWFCYVITDDTFTFSDLTVLGW